MAVGATGTPTPKGIPKYNTGADAPSGQGFNSAMDAIDALLDAYSTRDMVTPAGTRLISNKLLEAHANPAFRIMGDGDLEWGAGGASAPDTTLYRSAVDILKTDDVFHAGGAIKASTAGGTGQRTYIGGLGPGSKAALVLGEIGSNEAVLYRDAADVLRTDDSVWLDGTELRLSGSTTFINAQSKAAAGTEIIQATVVGDTNRRFALRADGRMLWGDGTNAIDVSLYRNSADILRTDDDFHALRFQATAGSSPAFTVTGLGGTGSHVLTGKVIGDVGNRFILTADGTLLLGSGGGSFDTNLYRASADVLKTDDNFHSALDVVARAGTAAQVSINGNIGSGIAGIQFGSALDTNLYRAAADLLRTDDAFESKRAAAADVSFYASVAGDTVPRWSVGADGKQLWGIGTATRDMQMLRVSGPGLQFGGLASSNRYTRLMDAGEAIVRMDNNGFQRVLNLQNFGINAVGQGIDFEFRLGSGGVDRAAAVQLRADATDTWTATGSTQDADFVVRTALNGVLGEVARFTSANRFKLATGALIEFPDGTTQNTAPSNPATVTSLPGSPVDGQEIIFTDSLTAPTYRWRLQYEAGDGKWWFIGGTPLFAEVITQENTSSGTYTALATAGPSIALPVAGDYDVEIGAFFMNPPGISHMSYDIGGTGAVDADAVKVQGDGGWGSASRARRKTGLTAVTLTSKYRTSTGTVGIGNRWMRVIPIKIG